MIDQDTIQKRLLVSNKSLNHEDDTKNEHGYQTINQVKDEESKLFNQELYIKYMSSRLTSTHIKALSLYILSLISFCFLIFQMFLIIRIIQNEFIWANLEMSFLMALTFFGISSGIVVNYYFLNDISYKMKTLVCSSITCGLALFIIISSSEFILFLCHPLLSFFSSIFFYSVKNYFEEYFLSEEYDSLKTSLLIVFSFSFLLVYLNFIMLVESWNLFLICSMCLNFSVFILAFFMTETPMYWFKLKEEELLFSQLEKINDLKISECDREHILEELKKMDEHEKSIKVTTIFKDDLLLFSTLYFIISCLISYVTVGMTMIGVSRYYDVHYRNKESFKQLFFFVIICAFGPVLGWILTNFTKVKRKIYIISHFVIMTIFAFLMVFFNRMTEYYGGIFLFFSLSLVVLYMKFGLEVYRIELHNKVKLMFSFTIFSFAFISVLVINALYFYRINASFISLIVCTVTGFGLTFFFNLDIN